MQSLLAGRVVWRRKGYVGLEFSRASDRALNMLAAYMQRLNAPILA